MPRTLRKKDPAARNWNYLERPLAAVVARGSATRRGHQFCVGPTTPYVRRSEPFENGQQLLTERRQRGREGILHPPWTR
jgi:hypothetical protein